MLTTFDFLNTLYKFFDPEQILYLWTLPDKITYSFKVKDLPKMATTAGQLADRYDVYYGVGATNRFLGSNERGSNEDIVAIPGLKMDIDVYHPDAHKTKDLPPDIASAMGLIPRELPPTLIVYSGYGIHPYWLFKEPWELNVQEEHKRATELSHALQAKIKHTAAQKGWKLDTTSDLARILRLPGTINRKISGSPVLVQVIENSGIRYNPSDIEDLLPPLMIANASHREEKFERRDTDGPAELMLKNCLFLMRCQLDAAQITYAEWVAMLTNVVRAKDGIEVAHQVSALDPARYNHDDTDRKITEALNKINPQTCKYVQSVIGFKGCPKDGCGVQAPCGWSLGKVAQAKALIRDIPDPSPEKIFTNEVLGALALLKEKDQVEYVKFKTKCKGKVNTVDLERLIKQQKSKRQENHLRLVPSDEFPKEDMLSDTVGDTPLDLVKPNSFIFDGAGVKWLKETDEQTYVFKALGAPAIISERLFNVDIHTEKLEICFKYLNGWRKAVFPRSVIADSKKILQLSDYGIPITSESAKYAVKWFDTLADVNQDRIPVNKAVSKLGWRGDKEFILPGFNSKYRIDINDDGSQDAISGFTSSGDLLEWVNCMNHLRRQSHKARFILAASFSTPLLRILGHRNFLIHNWGSSRGGKTATLWAAMSVWGNPDKIIGTFDATATALERKAALHSDLPLAIDEREVLSQQKKTDINPLLYILGQGRGRSRGTKTGLQHLATWRTVGLSTGEGTLSNVGSLEGVMTRVLEISGGPLINDEPFAKSLYSFLKGNHGHAGPEYLKKLLEAEYGAINSIYQDIQKGLNSFFHDRISSHIDAVACVATADYLSSVWIFGEPREDAWVGAVNTAKQVMGELITSIEASESERAWEVFIDWLAENEDRFSIYGGGRYGYTVNDEIYVIRNVVNKFLSERFSNYTKIVAEWGETGKIQTFYEGKAKKYDCRFKRVEGTQPRVIKILNRGI